MTSGGSGGHFYPIIAVAKKLNAISEQEKIAKLDLIFMSDAPYDKDALLRNGISFKKTYAGKIRRYFSLLNFLDIFKMAIGIIKSAWDIFLDFPDVIYSKGAYASLPAVFAAKIFGIPLLIHESDSVPGKVNAWAGKFAKRVAISFPETANYFAPSKIAVTGVPVREELFTRADKAMAMDFFNLETNVKTIFIIGGSLGSTTINDNLLEILSSLLEKYQIIHQCGKDNIKEIEGRSALILENSQHKSRYRPIGYLDISAIRMAYGAADIVVSRAGSIIFEIAASGLPSILIPLKNSAQDHQKKNAYFYASTGATDVIEEDNLSPHVLASQLDILLENDEKLKQMSIAAKKFARSDAAELIAREILALALSHA